MADPERGRQVLAELRRLRRPTSIDDYGTGYSSLAYLRHLPADELKLDRSLTADVDRDHRAAAIVEHTVALAHALGLRLVAEGVEDAATGAALAALGATSPRGTPSPGRCRAEFLTGWSARTCSTGPAGPDLTSPAGRRISPDTPISGRVGACCGDEPVCNGTRGDDPRLRWSRLLRSHLRRSR